MEYLIIDDNDNFAKKLCEQLNNNASCNEKSLQFTLGEETIALDINKHTTGQIAQAIIETYGESNNGHDNKLPEDLIIFININLLAKGKQRQEQAGVELLIWLRIKGVMNHCVLYSFQTIHSLLQHKPEHLILTSKGTTFVQLPSGFGLDYNKLVEERSKKEDVIATLKPMFNIEEHKHSEANWWGVKALYDVYNVVNTTNEEYPNEIKDKLENLKNAVAKEIYEIGIEKIDTIIIERTSELNTRISILNENIDKLISESLKQEEIDVEIYKIQEEIIGLQKTAIHYHDSSITKQLQSLQNNLEDWKTISNSNLQIQNEIETQQAKYVLSQRQQHNILIDIRERFQTLITTNNLVSSSSNSHEVLYIDDNAKKGWLDIIQKMTSLNNLKAIVPDVAYKNDINSLYNNQVKGQISDNTALILLDLRLYDEKDRSADIHSFSGTKLLQILRKEHKGIPVLILTASNKVWSYEELMKIGADAYWMKEGLDNYLTAEESVRNYFKLLWLIERIACSKEYETLRKLAELLSIVEGTSTPFWWETHTWSNSNITNVGKQTIIEVLNETVKLYKWYLHSFYLEYATSSKMNTNIEKTFFLFGLVNKFGIIVELLHGINSGSDFNKLNTIIKKDRKDFWGAKLRDFRNTTSHVSSLTLQESIYFEAVEILIKYLTDNSIQCISVVTLSAFSVDIINNSIFLKSDNNTEYLLEEHNITDEVNRLLYLKKLFNTTITLNVSSCDNISIICDTTQEYTIHADNSVVATITYSSDKIYGKKYFLHKEADGTMQWLKLDGTITKDNACTDGETVSLVFDANNNTYGKAPNTP